MNAPHPVHDAARIEANRAYVREHIPEALPWIKALHAAGMIEGWRNVTYAGPIRPSAPGMVPWRPFESMPDVIKRMGNGRL